MKKNLVIDDDIVENKTLYKKVNDIKKERENEKKYYCFVFFDTDYNWWY